MASWFLMAPTSSTPKKALSLSNHWRHWMRVTISVEPRISTASRSPMSPCCSGPSSNRTANRLSMRSATWSKVSPTNWVTYRRNAFLVRRSCGAFLTKSWTSRKWPWSPDNAYRSTMMVFIDSCLVVCVHFEIYIEIIQFSTYSTWCEHNKMVIFFKSMSTTGRRNMNASITNGEPLKNTK